MSGTSDNSVEAVETLLSELESVERQLRALRDGLTRSHRLATLGTIATIIAHEFNNVLTPVVSYCQLAQSHPEDIELQKKAVDKSLKGALKAAEISSSMLAFARDADLLDDDRADGSHRPAPCAPVRQVIDDVFATLARHPSKDGINLTVDAAEGLCAGMTPTALSQVLLNLVLNARGVMMPRGGKLSIRASKAAGPHGGDQRVRIEVCDSGPGIPDAVRARLFEPFITQRVGCDPDRPRGTGLGLAICRDLVRYAGGAIELTQTGPGGTTFTIDLPAAKAGG